MFGEKQKQLKAKKIHNFGVKRLRTAKQKNYPASKRI